MPLEDATKEILEEMLEQDNPLIEEDVEVITKKIAWSLSIYSSAGFQIIQRAVKAWLWDYSEGANGFTLETYKGIPIFGGAISCCATSEGPAIFGYFGPGGLPLASCIAWE